MSNRESNASQASAASRAPTWGPPKTPLSPDRLAKLANALGVSTPLPAVAPSVTHSFSSSPTSLASPFRGSPVPSRASSRQSNVYATPMTSRYLLHVIPPLKLPHDIDADYDWSDNPKTPPLPAASGYHSQFRRGILVPVHSTLQSQLSAIAKEYALPSTTGVILYLVQSKSQNGPSADAAEDGPGARLSEDIWRHLWLRVVKSEHGDDMPPSRSLSPNNLGLGVALPGARSTPHLLTEGKPLRPLLSSAVSSDATLTPAIGYPTPTTPSTASGMSHSNSLKSERSIMSSNALSSEESGPGGTDTPDSSRANSFDLPGLGSSAIIPILAKVEFDIDKRKATWFGPWMKNRKRNHVQRQGSADQGPVTLKLPSKLQARPGWLDQGNEEVESPIGSESDYDDDTAISGQPGLNRQNTLNRNHFPAPLMIPSASSLSSGEDSGRITSLPYLQGSLDEHGNPVSDNGTFKVRRATGESVDKRGGGVFDDLDLGLEESMDEIYDQQFALSAELDELEKSMAQNSPRPLKSNLSEEQNRTLAVEALTGQGNRASQLELPARTSPRTSSVGSSSSTIEGSELEVPSTPQLTLNGVFASSPGPTPPPKSPQHQASQAQNPSQYASSSRNSPEAPLIPLSPDPFGRFSTSRTSHDAGSSRQSSTYWETQSSAESMTTASRSGRSMDAERSSRFSADSAHEIDAVAAVATSSKTNRTTMMSVKGIKKLWRRSNKQSVSGPPVPTNTEPNPQRNSNVSTNVGLGPPNGQSSQPPAQQRASTPTGGMGTSSRPPRTSSIVNNANSGLGPPNGSAPSRPERPSQDELDIPDIPQHLYVPAPAPFNGRNSSPIVPSKMMSSRGGNGLDKLHFDQESPYPMPSRRSPPSRPYQQAGPPPPSSGPLEAQSNGVRKSILKWKNNAHSSQNSIGSGENAQHLHVRRPSGSSSGPSRGPSPSSMGPPPSPRIPEQYLNSMNHGHLTTPSMDSQNNQSGDRPHLSRTTSLASSRLSDDANRPSLDTRPSIDSSQFEMVSPKVGTLTYPYTEVEGHPQP